MSDVSTLKDSKPLLFLKAICCVIAADGRVRSAEIKSLSRELEKLGVTHSDAELSALVVEYSKAIHAAKPEVYATNLAESLASLRGTKWGAALMWALRSMSGGDEGTGSREREVMRVLNRAMGVGVTNVAPTAQSFTVESATRLVAIVAPLVFSASICWYLLAPILLPSLYYSLPAVSVSGERADWVTFSDWKMEMYGNRLQAVVAYHPKERSMLPRPCYIRYNLLDRAGVKLGGRDLNVPQIKAGEKARVDFLFEKGTRRLEISVGSM